ncbi:MAG: GNAT family protein [Eudoraea sp.]|uniref:GNAT family N-acetyltransferase n=1 Tax=Eudoraea sp. TaxID=1979955 RepID=UPI003C742045
MNPKEVILRELHLSDISQLAKLANNENICVNLRDSFPYPYNESDAKIFINSVVEEKPKQNFGIEYEGDLCGVIGLIIQKDVYRKSAEIGYWIGESYWGKGIATKAIKLITKYGFEDLKLARIYAGVFEFNMVSMKVLENNGYKKEGVFKKAVFKNANFFDEHRYFKLNEF